jgi:small nuclear ribonucleoprotein (snRNP)-like protein
MMLDELLNQEVVIDMSSTFVCIGTVTRFDDQFIELKHADVHDLRDTETSRENYVVESKTTGIKRNRRRVLIVRKEIVAIALLRDVVDT